MEKLLQNPEMIVVGATLVVELILRMIPKAWPLTRIAYEVLNKVVSDKK